MNSLDVQMLYKHETGQQVVYTEIELLRMRGEYYMVEGSYQQYLRHNLANDGACFLLSDEAYVSWLEEMVERLIRINK